MTASPAAFGEVDEGVAPCGEAGEGVVDGGADEEAHVGGDLLVAAAAGVELEGEVADLFGEFEFDVVVDVFGLGVGGDDGFALFGLLLGYGAEALLPSARSSSLVRMPAACDGAGVGYAGFYFVGEEAPVEGEGALPCFELRSSGSRKRPDHIFVGCCGVHISSSLSGDCEWCGRHWPALSVTSL